MSCPAVWSARHGGFPRLVAGDGAFDHVAARHALQKRREFRRLVGEVLRRDEQPGTAVGHDIVDLGRGQPRADGGVDQARALGTPADLEEARIVLEEDRDVIAGGQAERAEKLRDAVGLLVELAVGHRLAAARHDVGRLVGVLLGVDVGVHVGPHETGRNEARQALTRFRPSALFAPHLACPRGGIGRRA
jgi:hypothetical protein